MTPAGLPRLLTSVARRHQERRVLPHCSSCARPCCGLETLVLELTWARVRRLWGLEVNRAEFDRALARGEGPPEIRPQEGLYYAHGRACPAYRGGRCAVYATGLKPPGCSDFPIYEEEGGLVADLRCEAVDLPALRAELSETLGPGWTVGRSEHSEFPFLVSLRPARRRKSRQRRRRGLPGSRA